MQAQLTAIGSANRSGRPSRNRTNRNREKRASTASGSGTSPGTFSAPSALSNSAPAKSRERLSSEVEASSTTTHVGPRRLREFDHLCSDRVDHTNARETRHHPRRRRATLGARQKLRHLAQKKMLLLSKSPLKTREAVWRAPNWYRSTLPRVQGRQARWLIFGEQTRSISRKRRSVGPTSRIRASNLYQQSANSREMNDNTVRCLFQFLRISNPSADDIMFTLCVREFGFTTALWLGAKFQWKCQRSSRALCTLMWGHGTD